MPSHPATQARNSVSQPLIPAQLDLETLVSGYYAYIQRLTLSILNDVDEAEDATQETFISAGRNLGKFRGDASQKTWLTTIAVNNCRSRLRKRKVRQVLQTALEALHLVSAGDPNPEGAALQKESDQRLWRAVEQLDEKHRTVVILRYLHELSVPEIARLLGTQEGTVHSRLHHARQQLLGRLDKANAQAEVYDGTP